MKQTSSSVSKTDGRIGIFAFLVFLMLSISTFGIGWISLGAVADAPASGTLGEPGPEPTGAPGSGWIPDQLVSHSLGVDSRLCDLATGPGGSLHAVWAGDVAVGGWNIFYSRSDDDGLTWSVQTGVAGAPEDELNPSIAVSPADGRIFVAYEHWATATDAEIHVAWSDDGSAWNDVLVDLFPATTPQNNPSITVEHNMGAYYVYLTFGFEVDPDNQNVYVYRSTDRGLSWTQQLDRGGADADVHMSPDIAYQQGADGVDRLFVVYARGGDLGTTNQINIEWSEDYAASWNGPYTIATEANPVDAPSIAASRNGDSIIVAWQHNVLNDYSIRYTGDDDPTTPDAGWDAVLTRSPTLGNDADDLAPEIVADGEGTMDTTIGGNYHLIWTSDSPQYTLNYSWRPTDLVGGFSVSEDVTDTGGDPSGIYPMKGLTTQERDGNWYAGLVYSSWRATPYDVYYTTPGSRVIVDTVPANMDVEVDLVSFVAPVNLVWPAGRQHSLSAVSPQAAGPGQQWVFDFWSDAGAESHFVTATDVDTTYTCNYKFQYEIVIATAPINLDVEVDLVTYLAPVAFWWDDGSLHDIGTPSPQNTLPGIRYSFNSWSDTGAQYHQVTASGPVTHTASFDREYYVDVEAFDTTNVAPLNGVEVTVDGFPVGFTPWGGWFQEVVTYNIGVEDPYFDGVNNFIFFDWSTGSGNNPLMYSPMMPDTLIANYVEAPSTYFSLSVVPLSVSVAPGVNAVYTVTVQSHNGYTGNVGLSTVGNPGVETFVPPTVSPPADGSATSTLTIDTTGVTDGTYAFTIIGDDGMFVNNTGAELIVTTPTFDVTASPGFQTIANAAGQTAVIDVTVSSVNGYSGPVDLDVSSTVPGGFIPPATYVFVPAQVNVPMDGSANSVLTITNAAGVPDDTYAVWIEGDDGLDTDDFAVDVQVTSVPFFTIDASPPLRSISPGDVTSYVVTVTSVNSYTGNVDVSVVHAISTTHASLTWDSTALVIPDGGSDSATLTVDTTGSIPIQDYTLDFWADDGGTNITDQSILNLTSVISGSISGTVTDQDGEPIDDADVELVEGSNVIDTTITNNDGEYDFDNVDGGTYTVRATKDGYEDDDRQVTITAGDPDKTNIDLQLDLTTYEIEGDLVDKDSEDPIAGATVEVLDENGDLVDSDTTSGNGHFSIDDLPPGTYTVRITADGYKTTTQEVEITDEDVDLEDVEISPEAEPLDIGAYWWLILLIIIIVVVIILVALLAKRKKPEPETVPPGAYAEAQVPQPPSEAPPPAPPEGWPQPPERTPEPPPPGTPPEGPPPGQ